ncbi:cell division protein ZapD [Giesbergeria sinuosa]
MRSLSQKPGSVILYEYPFNERIRTYLRLEQLFRRLGELIPRSHPLDHHFALATIFEIIEVGARTDLKTDVLKDIEKQKQLLESYRGNPAISEKALDAVLAQLERCFAALNEQTGRTGQSLMENDWLMTLRSRMGIPGGTCGFDLPSYHAWQCAESGVRQKALQEWTATLAPLAESIYVLMQLLRDTGVPQKMAALQGNFQQNLPQGRSFQLLRLAIDPALGIIPEISGNRLRVSVRMMQLQSDGQLLPSTEDASFELSLCA